MPSTWTWEEAQTPKTWEWEEPAQIEPPREPKSFIPVGEETVLTPEQLQSTENIANRLRLKERIQRVESPVSTGLRESALGGVQAITSPAGLAWTAGLVAAPEVVGPILFGVTAPQIKPKIEEIQRARESGDRADYYRAVGDLGQTLGVLSGTARTVTGLRPPLASDVPPIIRAPSVLDPLQSFMPARVQPGERAGIAIPSIGPAQTRPGLPTQPKSPAPMVPETVAEARETVIEAIRKADARTLAQIQALFPEARLSREQARTFRNIAFPPVAEPVRPQATVAEVLGTQKPPPEPLVPAPLAPIESVPPLTDPVGNAPEFYSLPRLRALERNADPRIVAAKRYYGAKTIPDLARLANARFDEMRAKAKPPEEPKPATEPPLSPEEQAAAQRQLEEEVPAARAEETAATETKPPPEPNPATEAPVERAQAEVSRVASTEGKRSAKEIKDELVARLQQAIKTASEGDLTHLPPEQRKVTIEIPGDGTFTVWNQKSALEGLLKRAQKIATDPGEMTGKVSIPPKLGRDFIKSEASRLEAHYKSPWEAWRQLETQKKSGEPLEDKQLRQIEAVQSELGDRGNAEIAAQEREAGRLESAILSAEERIAQRKAQYGQNVANWQMAIRRNNINDEAVIKEKRPILAGIEKKLSALKDEKAAALEESPTAPKPAATEPPKAGPGAASPSEFAERTVKGAGAQPPAGPPQIAIDAGAKPMPEVARANKDFNLFNKANSGQWTFYFGKLGGAAKAAWDKMTLAAFKIREDVGRDTQRYVDNLLASLPRPVRSKGGKVFFDALDGKPIDAIESEWAGKPHGEQVIKAAQQIKDRLEEIRVTIRDTKRESYHGFLMGLDRDTLSQLFDKNMGRDVDTSKYSKEMFADGLTRSEFPDDWGISDGSYIPHLFTGNWKVTARRGDTTEFVTRAKTVAEAKAQVFKRIKENPDYANADWKIEQDTVIPADMIRLGDRRFWNLVQRMKDNLGVTSSEVKQAQQGIIGRKASKQKWFGSLQQRRGFQGYSHDFRQTMTSYMSGFHRWLELTKLNREVQPLIEQVRREGRTNAAEQLDVLMENLWGKPPQSTLLFDNFIRDIPGLRDYIKPLALDRWSRNIKSMLAFLTLKTARFAVVNRLQPLQGLYPLVGERILAQAKIRQHTTEGRALLDEAGVRFDPGQYGAVGNVGSKLKAVGERISGERSNQELAFLAMYQHGTESGLSHPEAINYAKLRGQLMTQFTPVITDIPPIMRGPFSSLLFQFKRFPIKQAELLTKMVAERNFGGIGRWIGVMAATGGLSYFMRQFLLPADKRERLRRSITNQHGEGVANAVMYGLPGLVNTDLSGSLVLGDEPFGSNIYEKVGRQVTGPAVGMAYEHLKGVFTEPREPTTITQRAIDTLRKIPTLRPLAELIALEQSDLDVRTPDGETKYRKAVRDAIVNIGSFRTANESNTQSAVNAIVELKRQTSELKNAAFVAYSTPGGNPNAALDEIQKFNERWPEVAITGKELVEYIHARTKGTAKTDYERLAGRKFYPLLPSQPTR